MLRLDSHDKPAVTRSRSRTHPFPAIVFVSSANRRMETVKLITTELRDRFNHVLFSRYRPRSGSRPSYRNAPLSPPPTLKPHTSPPHSPDRPGRPLRIFQRMNLLPSTPPP